MCLSFLYVFVVLSPIWCYLTPPSVNVNLDNGENTWNDAIDTILNLHGFDYSFKQIFEKQNQSIFNYLNDTDYNLLSNSIKQHWPNHYTELQGISKRFEYHGYYVSTEYLCAWAYYHELYHIEWNVNNTYFQFECTGILLRDKNDNIWHGRNHDPSQGWNITLSLSFYKNNKLIFEGRDYYWFATGIVTAFKNNVLSIQENAKKQWLNYSQIMQYIQDGRIPVTFLFREMLSKDGITYETGVDYVCNVPLSVPIYAIVGGLKGPNDGSVITKYQDDCILLTFNNVSNHSSGNYGNYSIPWFIVETNSDLWEPDNKRSLAENMLLSWNKQYDTQQIIVGTNLLSVMSSYNIYNPSTITTSIMSAVNNIFVGYIASPLKEICQQVMDG